MLVVVDSTRKVSTLRAFMPDHKIIAVDFPLYTRFRKAKSKLDVWPTLRPSVQEVRLLQKQAHGQDVLGIFDDTEYGRVQARDLVEALSDLNNSVMVKFVLAYTRQAIDAADAVVEAPTDCDVRYLVNRLINDQITRELEQYCGDEADLACTWHQAVLLECIRSCCTPPEHTCRYVDPQGRVYTGTHDPDAPATRKVYAATFKPLRKSILDMVDAGLDLEDVQTALDKLRSAGHVAVRESDMRDSLFQELREDVLTHADSLHLEGFVEDSESRGFFVTEFNRDSFSLPEAEHVRVLHSLLRTETILGCCGPVRGNMVVASVDGMETTYVHPDGPSWLPLTDIPVSTEPPAISDPAQVQDFLLAQGASNRAIMNTATSCRLTSRDVWLALKWMLARRYVVRRDGFWYLTSRGCLVLHVLETVFPSARTSTIADSIDRIVEQHHKATNNTTEIRRLETMSAVKTLLQESIREVMPDDLWRPLAGDEEVHVSPHAAWVVSAGTAEGLYFDAAEQEFRPIQVGASVFDPCPCGSTDTQGFVNTALDPTYATVVTCPACGLSRPLVGVLEKED